MGKQLDPTQMALLGVNEDRRHKIAECVERKCDGCGQKIYMSRSPIPHAVKTAKRAGKKLYTLCWKCAEPWLQDLAKSGGTAESFSEYAERELVDAISERRTKHIESN